MKKEKILICGILPPPFFGHSAIYKILMSSEFVDAFDVTFLNMRFWSFAQHKKVTLLKVSKMAGYYFRFLFIVLVMRPGHILYNMSWDKMPFLKDFLFCATGIILGRRIIIHDMGQYVRELYDNSGSIYKSLIRWLLKRTTACILLGESTKEKYEGLIDNVRLFPVPGSVEDTADVSEGPRRTQTDGDPISVLYFSYLSQSKGVFTAFKCVDILLSKGLNVKFQFAGPFESEQIKQDLEHLQGLYPGRIEYLGYIQDEKRRTQIFRNSDIFIFPTHRDVFGLVLLHAMAEGLPVVASLEGNIPEIICDCENGFLIPKGDAGKLAEEVEKLMRSPELRKTIGRANRDRYAAYYCPKVYGQNMISVFENIRRLT